MPTYPAEMKEQIIKKLLPPNNQSITQINTESGISKPTLRSWLHEARGAEEASPDGKSNPEAWSGEEKLSILFEVRGMNQHQLAEYCRQKGLFIEQIKRWREGAIAANENRDRMSRVERQAMAEMRKRLRETEKELERKTEALAETAALLVLKKKADRLWGEPEDDSSRAMSACK
jgi:transposase